MVGRRFAFILTAVVVGELGAPTPPTRCRIDGVGLSKQWFKSCPWIVARLAWFSQGLWLAQLFDKPHVQRNNWQSQTGSGVRCGPGPCVSMCWRYALRVPNSCPHAPQISPAHGPSSSFEDSARSGNDSSL